jgi:multidrug transporter EmrE-like cation transporter
MNLSVAYPVFSAAGIALVMLLSSMLFGEAIGSTRALGALVVALGIFMLTR